MELQYTFPFVTLVALSDPSPHQDGPKSGFLTPRTVRRDWDGPKSDDGKFLAPRANATSREAFSARGSMRYPSHDLFNKTAHVLASPEKGARSGQWENLNGVWHRILVRIVGQ